MPEVTSAAEPSPSRAGFMRVLQTCVGVGQVPISVLGNANAKAAPAIPITPRYENVSLRRANTIPTPAPAIGMAAPISATPVQWHFMGVLVPFARVVMEPDAWQSVKCGTTAIAIARAINAAPKYLYNQHPPNAAFFKHLPRILNCIPANYSSNTWRMLERSHRERDQFVSILNRTDQQQGMRVDTQASLREILHGI